MANYARPPILPRHAGYVGETGGETIPHAQRALTSDMFLLPDTFKCDQDCVPAHQRRYRCRMRVCHRYCRRTEGVHTMSSKESVEMETACATACAALAFSSPPAPTLRPWDFPGLRSNGYR